MSLSSIANQELINKMDLIKKVVELWLSFRGAQKIKVKQPLSAIYINKTIESKYENIILEELNVKNIVIDESLVDKVKTVCLPDGKKLGKKLGKDFQNINNMAKNWEYIKNPDWSVTVGEYTLLPDEFEIRYEKGDLAFDIIVDDDLILMMDTNISDELLLEWYAREIVRSIQEARKQTWYEVSDKIYLNLSGYRISDILSDLADWRQGFKTYIYNETLATEYDGLESDYNWSLELDEGTIQIKLKKQ